MKKRSFRFFDSSSLTEAQKQEVRQYRPGMAIHFHRATRGLDNNEAMTVAAIDNDSLMIQRTDGSEDVLPLGTGAACFDVGEERKLKEAAGNEL